MRPARFRPARLRPARLRAAPLRAALAAMILAVSSAGLSPARAEEPAPTPRAAPAPAPRPDVEGSAAVPDVEGPAPRPDVEAPAAVPAERPGSDDAPPAYAPPASPPRPGAAGAAPAVAPPAETEAEFAACRAELERLGSRFAVRPALREDENAACGVARPVELAEAAPGVAVEPPALLRCEAALALARWTAEVALPAARHLPERGRLTGFATGTGYLCRPRNGVAGARLSEHAFGNALDVAGFAFADGPPLPVGPRAGTGDLDEAFQRAVRGGACLHFTTVIGPGTDAAHGDHLHLDVRARNGGYRLCQ